MDGDLSNANLIGADLRAANCDRANFSYANLIGTSMRKVRLRRANLTGAKLQRTNLSEAELVEAHLNEADLSNANLYDAELLGIFGYKTNFYRVQAIATHLTKAYLFQADFSEAELIKIDLRWANCDRVNFRNSNLQQAVAYRDLKEYDNALKFVDKALEIAPENPEHYYLKGQILMRFHSLSNLDKQPLFLDLLDNSELHRLQISRSLVQD